MGAGIATASTQSWGMGGMDILALHLRSDGTCPGLDLRDMQVQMTPVVPTVTDVEVTVTDASLQVVDTAVERQSVALETVDML